MNVSSVALSIKMAATATGESPLAANLTLSPFALKDIVTASFLTTAILFAAAPDIIPYEPELSKYFSGVNVAYLKPLESVFVSLIFRPGFLFHNSGAFEFVK